MFSCVRFYAFLLPPAACASLDVKLCQPRYAPAAVEASRCSCKYEFVLKLKVRRINSGRNYERAFRVREWVLFTHSIRFLSRARFEWSSCNNILTVPSRNVFLSPPSELYRAFDFLCNPVSQHILIFLSYFYSCVPEFVLLIISQNC